jgi:colicin import membrane protein
MVTTASSKTPKTRRTKAEVQLALDNIIQDKAEEQQLQSSKVKAAEKLKEEEIHAAVDHLTAEVVLNEISSLNSEISKVFAEISAKITREINLLYQLREAVALERKEMEKLHKVDVIATAIDQLLTDYELKKRDLETEIVTRKTEWEREEQLRIQTQKEAEESLKKERQRELDEYTYKKNLERKKAQDQFDDTVRLREKESQEKSETLNKQWQTREGALQEKEKAYAEALKVVEEFPSRLKKEVDIAVTKAVKEAQEKMMQETALLKKDYEAEKRLSEVKIKTFEDLVARQSSQIELLQKQADLAKKQVEEIAVKAIEGASEKRALEHVNLIAREQAKARSSNS